MCKCNLKTKEIVEKYKVPFVCKECEALKFEYKGLKDVVFVWPFEPPKKIGSFYIPDAIRENQEVEYAVVLSAGKGYWTDRGKFISTKVFEGDVVVYDKSVPWVIKVNENKVKYMSYMDVKGVIENFERVRLNT